MLMIIINCFPIIFRMKFLASFCACWVLLCLPQRIQVLFYLTVVFTYYHHFKGHRNSFAVSALHFASSQITNHAFPSGDHRDHGGDSLAVSAKHITLPFMFPPQGVTGGEHRVAPRMIFLPALFPLFPFFMTLHHVSFLHSCLSGSRL